MRVIYEPGDVVEFCIQPHTGTWVMGRVLKIVDEVEGIYQVRTLARSPHDSARYRRYGTLIRSIDAVTRLGLLAKGFGDYELDKRTDDVVSRLGLISAIPSPAPTALPSNVYLYTPTKPSGPYKTYQWNGSGYTSRPEVGDRVEVLVTNLMGRDLCKVGVVRERPGAYIVVDLLDGSTVRAPYDDVRRIDAITELGRLAE